MLTTYVVEGGIGKCTAFTAIVPKLAEKAGEAIQVYTPYVDLFAGNPHVRQVFDQASIPYSDPRVQQSDDIIFCEPYKSNFLKGKQHLIESYAEILGVSYNQDTPCLYTEYLKGHADKALSEANIGKFMIVQLTGGQTPVNFDPSNQYVSIDANRNYPFFLAQKLINQLREEFPDTTILNYSLPNEPNYEGTTKIQLPYAVWHEMLKKAEGFISIDSCLQHFSASAKKPGVVLWGSTRWSQLGYEQNTNLSFHMEDASLFDPLDPRNIMIDPQRIVSVYKDSCGAVK